ncbi:hypothetical protein MSG28_009165 [Choristoneura fumiferana]|uniref:Uncharacterized protein n=2 Tax=Choristoneura fumiferana TaxID=7141 RepID=A0ACC0KWE1_CHOFU|nr:hypothetical protein MSG28_009165 [Choristoneura fumiferana]
MSVQLQECSEQQTACMQETLQLLKQKGSYVSKLEDYDKHKAKMTSDIDAYKQKLIATEIKLNSSLVNVEMCKAEFRSLESLQVSKTGIIETLRLEKETLTTQLAKRQKTIETLEKEVERLKSVLTTKSAPNIAVSSKVTPAAQPPKLSSALNAHEPLNEPILDNDAKEDIDDTNALNDGQDFDPQM